LERQLAEPSENTAETTEWRSLHRGLGIARRNLMRTRSWDGSGKSRACLEPRQSKMALDIKSHFQVDATVHG
jgi:hypothetical protein